MLEPNELENALKVTAILTAIPVVLQAIWADHFDREIERRKKDEPDFDRAGELFQVKLAAFVGLIFQLLIFLSASDVRKAYPILCNMIFVTALAAHMWIQGTSEKKLAPPPAKAGAPGAAPSPGAAAASPEHFANAMRAFAWSLLSGIGYIGILILFMRASVALAQYLQVSSTQGLLLMTLGSALGILAGLGFGFAVGPFQLRHTFPCTPLESGPIRDQLEADFRSAGLRLPALWVIDLGPTQPGNALVAGFQSGRWIFRPTLFLSKAALANLSPEEIRAIVLHEVSHLKLRHLRKRFLLSFGLILGASVVAGATALTILALFPKSSASWFVSLSVVIAALVYSFSMLGEQSRNHEMEADLLAVQLGAGVKHLCSALRRLDEMNGVNGDRQNPNTRLAGSGHPSTIERIQRLENHFESELRRVEEMAAAGAAVATPAERPENSGSDQEAA